MCEIHSPLTIYRESNKNTYDPTRTLTIRNRFARKMRVRFKKVRREVYDAIVKNDVFGLENPTVSQSSPRQFDFPSNSDKISAFVEWLQELIDEEVLTVSKTSSGTTRWTDMYVEDTYKRGLIRARQEMRNAGMEVPPMEETGGVEASMSTPVNMGRVEALFVRAFEDLKGITSQMSTQISRVLSQGLMDGDNPRRIARKLNYVISGTGKNLGVTDTLGRFIPAERRAEMLARTEIIRAHHKGMIQEYREWGVHGVHVLAEIRTAGDHRVCDLCQGYEGTTYSLDEAENMIPFHPMCRCITIPLEDKNR
ncbi:MAG: minor capsid protein [Bacteroidales bacterium]